MSAVGKRFASKGEGHEVLLLTAVRLVLGGLVNCMDCNCLRFVAGILMRLRNCLNCAPFMAPVKVCRTHWHRCVGGVNKMLGFYFGTASVVGDAGRFSTGVGLFRVGEVVLGREVPGVVFANRSRTKGGGLSVVKSAR